MRLTKDIKTAILNAALKKAGILDKEIAIRDRYAGWAETVRVKFVTDEQLKLIEQAILAASLVRDELTDYSFHPRKSNAIENANVGGQRRTVYFCGAINREDRKSADRKSADRKITPYGGHINLSPDDPLTEQLYSIDHDSAALKSEREHLKLSILAVLDSVTTDKRLIQIWPESIAFIPAAERAATTNLPALPVANLNKMIGLP